MTNPKFMTPVNANKRKQGFTLTEIAIVLGIIGLILGAIWVAAASVYQNQRSAHANTAILQIAQGVRTLYATTSAFAAAGDITNDMATAKVIPSDMVAGAAGAYTAIDPWAGGVTKVLVPASLDSFTIEMTAVPQAPCIAVLTSVAGQARDQSLFAAASTSASGAAMPGTATEGTALTTAAGQMAQVDPTIAATACSDVTSNIIQFGFGLK